MTSTATGFSYDAAKGTLSKLNSVSTLPESFKGSNDTAELEVHPDGGFFYVSNRGHDSIALFAIDSVTGAHKFVETVSTGGKTPRNFAIDPSGDYLFAANQKSDNIVIFKIDRKTGHLTPTGHVLQAPSPVCVSFVAIE
jgi:6-phosphogluconolactonase